MRCILSVVVLVVTSGLVSGSAIPMWEFLSRGEKMSHLFNMFVKQVEDHCDQSTMPDCNKVLMVYGLTNLAKMDDDSLDKMDPYQRGAHDIIWDSMMKGSYKSPSRRTEPRQDFYSQGVEDMEPELSEGGNGLGSQEAASTAQEDVSSPGTGGASRYVIGPMVVRVLPDGSPVPGDAQRPLPRDEDAEEFRLMRAKPVPSLEELHRRQQHTAPSAPTAAPAPSAAPAPQRIRFVQQQHRHERIQESAPFQGQSFGRFPQPSASQPHAKFALPPPGMSFRIAAQ